MTPPTYEVEFSDADIQLIRLAAHGARQSIGCFLRAGNLAATVTVVAIMVSTPLSAPAKVVPFCRFQALRFFPQPVEACSGEEDAA